MSEYRIKNIQPYDGNSVIIDMKDTRVSIAVDGENAIECLESALRYLKGKKQTVEYDVNVGVGVGTLADTVKEMITQDMKRYSRSRGI